MIVLRVMVLILSWMIFLIVPIWLLGIQSARNSAWWSDEDKLQTYMELSSPAIAALLIPMYSGYSTHIRTNLPALYNQYLVNRYPARLSPLGAADYCVTAALGGWYGVCITAYFWLGRFDNPMIPLTLIFMGVLRFSLVF